MPERLKSDALVSVPSVDKQVYIDSPFGRCDVNLHIDSRDHVTKQVYRKSIDTVDGVYVFGMEWLHEVAQNMPGL